MAVTHLPGDSKRLSVLRGDGLLSNPLTATPNVQRAIRSVCAIVSGPHNGTGVLIGPDLVLTAYHVIDHVTERADIDGMHCYFDYVEDGADSPAGGGMEVGVLAVDVCSSPPSPGDLEGGPPEFRRDLLDYAILRLNSPMGRRPARDGRPRGWVRLPREPVVPDIEDEIYLFQHPEGDNFFHRQQPLRYGLGEVVDVLEHAARFVHTAGSAPGSSGGPCFDVSKDFAFVGLHNAGHRKGDTMQKRFVPLFWIVSHIHRKLSGDGIIGELFKEPPAFDQLAAPNDVEVARRRSVALWLMDRTTEEIKFRRKIEAQPADPQTAVPRVHLVVCQDNDKPDFFSKRLEHLPLQPTARERMGALLDGLAKGELARTFDGRLLGWPALDHPERRKDELDTLVSDLDTGGRQLIVFMGTYEDGMDVTSERALLEHLAAALHARFRGTAVILQCLVCLMVPERPDAAAIVESFAGLWTETSAPPGCGICIELSEIALSDLATWRDALENTWGENEAFRREMENLFRRDRRYRMARLAEELGDDIDQLIRTARTGEMGRQR